VGDGQKRWSLDDSSIEKAGAERLARMLDAEPTAQWSPADEAAALRQQLGAPLLPELADVAGVAGVELERLGSSAQGRLVEVLTAAVPEVELLRAVKLWARQVREQGASPLGASGATVIYYAAIAAVRVGGKESITGLSEAELRTGFEWARGVAGAEALRELFEAALKAMGPGESGRTK
jgi:hypothetical protein